MEQKIFNMILSKDPWDQVLCQIISYEGLDPWDLDLIKLGNIFINYVEKLKEIDFKDGIGFYAQSKSLGEIANEKDLTFRMSIIGPEIRENGTGLFHWFMTQKKQIKGYKNVYWTGKSLVGAGQLNFNVNTREIIWSINRIPLTVRELESNFEISITPIPENEGSIVTLIPETTIEAYDKKTGEQIFSATGVIDTSLEGDLVAEGRGIIIE